ncbi:hypothetical protein [Parasphingorhabdus cellanae]|uniref:Uncharacterized protein n=1 Tax=Parasphingorhabdus cellanae TaxID=2806553 RepID=A0ABX7TAA5_9SPHN|nr:hypothetical protein [Parasphingorhabdus cellanae]QTD57617.1 hypothetical protein J4G78_08930 [Parasphingorhabdus cellanae]
MADDNPHNSNLPVPAAEEPPPERPYRVRHDGWTAERQNIFIESLAKTRCVRDASRIAGISWNSAYRHRKRSPAFAERWALALRRAETTIGEVTWQRAVEGVEEDVWYYGKVVGKRTKYANDLLRLLYQHDTNGAGRDAQGRFAPSGEGAGHDADEGTDREVHDGAHPGPQYPDVDEPTTVAGRTIYPKWVSLPPPDPTKPKDTLDEKLKKISDNIRRLGSRTINLRTNQGMTDEVVEAVQRFVAGGRVMLPAKFKWLSPEKFEKAKAEFLAEYPGGVPEERKAEFNRE